MLQLIIIVIVFVYLFSALVGSIRFWRDLKQFKTEIEFPGNREQLIDLMLKRKEITGGLPSSVKRDIIYSM